MKNGHQSLSLVQSSRSFERSLNEWWLSSMTTRTPGSRGNLFWEKLSGMVVCAAELPLISESCSFFLVQPKKAQVSGGSVHARLLAQRRMSSAAPPTQPGSRVCHGRSTATLRSCKLRLEEENPGVYEPGSWWLERRGGNGWLFG